MPDLEPNASPAAPHEAPAPEQVASLDLREDEAVWTGWDVVLIAVVALVSIGVFSVVALIAAARLPIFRGTGPMELARDPRLIVPVQSAAYAIVLLFMWALVRSHRRPFWHTIRWSWPYGLWFGYLAGGAVLAFGVQIASALLPIPKQLPIEQLFRNTTGAYIMGVFGVLIAPLVEELFFRGFMFPVAVRRLGMVAGTVATAAIFALIHQAQLAHAWGALLLLFGVGLVLTITRAKTGSVAAGFLLHAGYNATLFVMLYFATDHFRHFERMT